MNARRIGAGDRSHYARTSANRPFVDFVIYRFARALGRIVELESEMRPDDYAPRLIVTDLEAVRSIARVLAEPGKSSGIVSVHVRNAPLVGQTVGLVGLLRQFKSNVDSALGSHVAVGPRSFVDGPVTQGRVKTTVGAPDLWFEFRRYVISGHTVSYNARLIQRFYHPSFDPCYAGGY